MTNPKPCPQVPAALCGLFPAATIRFPHGNVWLVGKVNPFNAVHNGYVQTIRQLGGTAGVSYSSVEIETAFLLLDSPLAMCHAARWLAERVGMDPGATAPGWAQYPCGEHCCNGETGEMAACTRPVWSLGTDEGFVLFMDCPNPDAWAGEECRHVPGIGDITDPAAALAAACAAVGGAS